MSAGRISIAQRMEDTRGRSTGFDYMRIILALAVIVWHSFPLSYGGAQEGVGNSWAAAAPIAGIILPMFFALSGFLVAGSLERNSLVSFVGLRVIRIVPALAVEVLLSALVLGPLLTTFALSAYFRDPLFAHYFLNVLGYIHYQLPGLFLSNPFPNTVNGQLWTVPWELRCYIALTGLAIFGLVSRRVVFILATVLATIVLMAWHMMGHGHSWGIPLLLGFLVGVAVYQFRDRLPWDWRIGLLSAVVMGAFLLVPVTCYFIAFPAAYVTVYLGLSNPRKISLLRGADYSYGLYLYGFAIQQAVANVFPWSHQWYWNLTISVPLAAAFAAMSWHCVEKPALRLRHFLPKLEAAIHFPRARLGLKARENEA